MLEGEGSMRVWAGWTGASKGGHSRVKRGVGEEIWLCGERDSGIGGRKKP